MKKLLVALAVLPALSFASSLDMSTLKCKDMSINSATTLQQVQSTCLIKEQKTHKGLYQVEFKNDTTGKNVKCDFATNTPTATVNGCR